MWLWDLALEEGHCITTVLLTNVIQPGASSSTQLTAPCLILRTTHQSSGYGLHGGTIGNRGFCSVAFFYWKLNSGSWPLVLFSPCIVWLSEAVECANKYATRKLDSVTESPGPSQWPGTGLPWVFWSLGSEWSPKTCNQVLPHAAAAAGKAACWVVVFFLGLTIGPWALEPSLHTCSAWFRFMQLQKQSYTLASDSFS